MATRKISVTKNYAMFKRGDDNRELNMAKHRKLEESMKRYGFLASYPISVHRNGDKLLIVKDGQHRLAFAETLGLPVYYVEEEVDFDVAAINCTSKAWNPVDFALKWIAAGKDDYQEVSEFAERHKLPLTMAASLLVGYASWSPIAPSFYSGSYKVKDRKWAHKVANIYSPMCSACPALRKQAFLQACIAICYVPEFEPERLLQNTERCREKLISYATRDAFLEMIEEVYNYGRSKMLDLRNKAVMAMRERRAVEKTAKKPA